MLSQPLQLKRRVQLKAPSETDPFFTGYNGDVETEDSK